MLFARRPFSRIRSLRQCRFASHKSSFWERDELIQKIGNVISEHCHVKQLLNGCRGDFAVRPKNIPEEDAWIPLFIRLCFCPLAESKYIFKIDVRHDDDLFLMLFQPANRDYGWMFDSESCAQRYFTIGEGTPRDDPDRRYSLIRGHSNSIGAKLASIFEEYPTKTMDQLMINSLASRNIAAARREIKAEPAWSDTAKLNHCHCRHVSTNTAFQKRIGFVNELASKVSEHCHFEQLPWVCRGDFAIRPKNLPYEDSWIPVHVRLCATDKPDKYNFKMEHRPSDQPFPIMLQPTTRDYGWLYDNENVKFSNLICGSTFTIQEGKHRDDPTKRYTLAPTEENNLGQKLASVFHQYPTKTIDELLTPHAKGHQKSKAVSDLGQSFLKKCGYEIKKGRLTCQNVDQFTHSDNNVLTIQHVVAVNSARALNRLCINYVSRHHVKGNAAPWPEEVADFIFCYLPVCHAHHSQYVWAIPKFEMIRSEILRSETTKGKCHFSILDPNKKECVKRDSKWGHIEDFCLDLKDPASVDRFKSLREQVIEFKKNGTPVESATEAA